MSDSNILPAPFQLLTDSHSAWPAGCHGTAPFNTAWPPSLSSAEQPPALVLSTTFTVCSLPGFCPALVN